MNTRTHTVPRRWLRIRAMAAAMTIGVAGWLAAPPASATPIYPARPQEFTSDSTDEVKVHGRVVTAANDTVSMTLPCIPTENEINIDDLPTGEFKGAGEPVLSTTVAGSLISTYKTDEGTQTLISIPSANAPSEYRFPLDLPEGGQAIRLADGSVVIVGADGEPLGGFHIPWAYDANGKELLTSFRVENDTLIQTVDISATTAFPVIADPDRGSEWWGVWFRYTKAETKKSATTLQNKNAVMIKDIMTAACALAPGWTAAACAVFIQAKWYMTMQPALDAYARGKCFVLNIPVIAPGITMNGTIVKCTR